MKTTHHALRIFEQALERPEDQRQQFIAQSCGTDARLQEEVEALVQADAMAGDFLHHPLSRPDADQSGREAGPWRLERLLGRGGMGQVYQARRADGLYERTAALKMLRFDLDNLRARFEQERNLLAAMDHPCVARMLDAGYAEDGAPYIAMEYVEGESISDYCLHQQLDIRSRIELFIKVLDAAQHAHGHLVVHRDIKSSNILIDEHGTPKLLDFGIAKLLDESRPSMTRTGEMPMTPEYASPEQVRGQPVGIASDVYSLGALLYQLLTGEPPYHIKSTAPGEIVRAVCETEPNPPSRVTNQHGLKLNRDLDHVLLKALAKQPEHRYKTCAEFAQDLQRYLDGLPVQAVHAGWRYRAGKFISRHRMPVAIAALVAFALTGTTFFALQQARYANKQAELAREQTARAEIRRDQAETLSQFLSDMLAAPDPRESGREVTVVELLNDAANKITDALGTHPETAAIMHSTLAESFWSLGHTESAREQAEAAFSILADTPSTDPTTFALTHLRLARVLRVNEDFEDATELLLSAREALNNYQNALVVQVNLELGAIHQELERYDAEREYLQSALDMARNLEDEEPMATPAVLNNLANSLSSQGEYTQALPLFEEALSRLLDLYPEPHPYVATTLFNLATTEHQLGNLDAAAYSYEHAMIMYNESYGPDHVRTLTAQADTALFYLDVDDVETAAYMSYEAWNRANESLSSSHPRMLAAIATTHGIFLTAAALFDEAIETLQTALQLRQDYYPENHHLIASTQCALGDAMAQKGLHNSGIPMMQDAFERLKTQFPAEHRMLRRCQNALNASAQFVD